MASTPSGSAGASGIESGSRSFMRRGARGPESPARAAKRRRPRSRSRFLPVVGRAKTCRSSCGCTHRGAGSGHAVVPHAVVLHAVVLHAVVLHAVVLHAVVLHGAVVAFGGSGEPYV